MFANDDSEATSEEFGEPSPVAADEKGKAVAQPSRGRAKRAGRRRPANSAFSWQMPGTHRHRAIRHEGLRRRLITRIGETTMPGGRLPRFVVRRLVWPSVVCLLRPTGTRLLLMLL